MSDEIKSVIAEAKELLRNAEFSDGLANVRTQDCEALEEAIGRFEMIEGETVAFVAMAEAE
jgi:hypothetical protein